MHCPAVRPIFFGRAIRGNVTKLCTFVDLERYVSIITVIITVNKMDGVLNFFIPANLKE